MTSRKGRTLAYTVHVAQTDGGKVETFGPGDKLPAWANDKIGDHAFEGWNRDKGEFDPLEDADDTDDGGDGDDDDEYAPPPLTGKGSGKGAWQDYAQREDVAAALEAAGVAIPEDASKDDIVAKLTEAGVRTE